jgi:hypothetical protein
MPTSSKVALAAKHALEFVILTCMAQGWLPKRQDLVAH